MFNRLNVMFIDEVSNTLGTGHCDMYYFSRVHRPVAIPPERMVRMEWRKVSLEISRPPAPIIRASVRNMMTPRLSGM
ncbi:hypothetical protein D3C75_1240880 [compost metagenome]